MQDAEFINNINISDVFGIQNIKYMSLDLNMVHTQATWNWNGGEFIFTSFFICICSDTTLRTFINNIAYINSPATAGK